MTPLTTELTAGRTKLAINGGLLTHIEKAALTARPVGLDYLMDIRARFGAVHMVHMEALGYGGEQRRPYMLEEGIAIIDVCGALSNDAQWWDETDYNQIRAEVAQALEDSEVKGILLNVNSPGGSTDGAFETAAFLAEAGKKKPLWAAANVMAYSAAYLLASQASKIYAPKISGGVGSVGVYCMHVDYSAALEERGIKITFISAGKGKTEGNAYEPLSEDAKAGFLANIERLYGEFVGAVSRGRSLSEEKVVALGAYTYRGAKAALESGLADVAGSVDQAWSDMVGATKVGLTSFAGTLASEQVQLPEGAGVDASADDGHRSEEETSMNEANAKPADAAAIAAAAAAAASAAASPTTLTQAQVDELVATARTEGRSEVDEVVALCTIARKPELLGGFIQSKAPIATVREALLKADVNADGGETTNRVAPNSNNATTGPDVLGACDKLVAKMKGGK